MANNIESLKAGYLAFYQVSLYAISSSIRDASKFLNRIAFRRIIKS